MTVNNSTKNPIIDAWEDPKYYFIKAVRIRSFSSPYVPAIGQNMEIYFTSLRIRSKCGKIQNRKTSNSDTFYAAYDFGMLSCLWALIIIKVIKKTENVKLYCKMWERISKSVSVQKWYFLHPFPHPTLNFLEDSSNPKYPPKWLNHIWNSIIILRISKTVILRCSVKKVFLEISQNSQENTCEFCEISKNTFFRRIPPVAASEGF